MALTGRPSQEDIDAIESELAVTMLEAITPGAPKQLQNMFPTASDEALDMLHKLL